jgi:hypothetical protein
MRWSSLSIHQLFSTINLYLYTWRICAKSDVLILLMLIGNVLKNKSVLTFATLNYQQVRKRIWACHKLRPIRWRINCRAHFMTGFCSKNGTYKWKTEINNVMSNDNHWCHSIITLRHHLYLLQYTYFSDRFSSNQ